MEITNLQQAAVVLHDYIPQIQSHDWTFALDDMKALMRELGDPQEKIRIIHVAGTSGKTSTCYYIANMLHRAGRSVGLTVSPHVDTVNERVQINGQPLAEAEFCQLLGQFIDLPAVQAHRPSYFGLLVAFAYWVFAQKQVDYAVIEVGLGGRLDATNVIQNPQKVAVITDIGLDHTELLGHDLATIAGEKAGIIQPGSQVFMAQQAVEVMQVIQARTQQLSLVSITNPPAELALFQQRNWSVAKSVVSYLAQRDNFSFSDEQALASAQLTIPGRMETLQIGEKLLIMDGAHNGQKVTALCQSLAQKYPDQKLATLISFAQGKDSSLEESMKALKTVADDLIVTAFKVEQDVPKQAIDPTTVAEFAQQAGFTRVTIAPKPSEAFANLLAQKSSILLITGSFYLLNHIRPLVKELHHD